jgi:HEAT repeat protein
MKTIYRIGVVLVGLSIVTAGQAQTGEELVAQLTGRAQGPARDAAQWAEAYQKAVDYLLPLMSAEDIGSRYAPQILLQDMGSYATRPGAEAQRLALAQVMVKTLEQAKMENTVRNWFILQLERIGKAESVGLLAKLMSDEDKNTRDYARRALEKNPDAGATEALLKELAGAREAAWKIGLVNSLGDRRASSAVKPLAQALSDSDPNVAQAAASALARIGGQESAQALLAVLARPVGPVSAKAAQSLIDMAEAMTAAKNTAGAARIYGSVYEWAGKATAVPVGIRVAAATGLIVTDTQRGVREAVTLIQDENPKMRQAALQAARLSTSKAVTQALTALLPKLPSDSQVQVLGLIGDVKDTSAEAAVVQVLAGTDEAVSLAAADALSRLGTETSAKTLFDAAVNGRGNVQKAAQSGLAVMSGPPTDALLKAQAVSGAAQARAVAIDLLGQRRSEGTAKLLLAYAAETDETVSAAAFQAMANVADAVDPAALTELVVKAKSDGARAASVTALKAVLAKAQDKEAAGKIVIERMNQAQGQTKLALLGSLTSVGGTAALAAVTNAARSSEEAVRDAGIRTLSEWPDYEAVPALVEIASNAQTPLNPYVLAVRGALRLIALQQPSMGPRMGPPTGLRMGQRVDPAEVESRAGLCVKIFDQARRIEEKRQALATLATLPCERSANRLLELVKDESLKTEAALAAVNLAGAMLRTDRQAAQDLAKKILDMNVSADINDQANAVLSGRGMRGMRGGPRAQ